VAEALCVALGAKTLVIAATAFTLSWTHSVEKTDWREDWVIESGGLRIAEAWIKGSGAGMEPPDGAVLRDGWWRYRPVLPAQKRIALAASGATAGGWTLCADGSCRELGAAVGEAIELSVCPMPRD
jgi:hypothetical protein